MRRAGIVVLILAMAIIGVELVLSVLRDRHINLAIQVEGSLPAAAAARPAEAAADDAGTLLMAPAGSITVQVVWNYRIGPKFPTTIVRAALQNTEGETVAAGTYTIDCSRADSLQCVGEGPIRLYFGVKDGEGERAAWPTGAYALQITRSDAGLEPLLLVERPVLVGN